MLAKGSFFPDKSALRSATVTISVPLASRAAAMLSFDENLPVPSRRRDRKARPAMRRGSAAVGMIGVSTNDTIRTKEKRAFATQAPAPMKELLRARIVER